jgi:dienelactone hydrolase
MYLACLLLMPLLEAAVEVVAAEYKLPAQTGPVQITRFDWIDVIRDRKVPVKIYSPQAGKGPLPVLLFSHGLGGSREGYEYLGRAWAGHGYISVHLQHAGSDSAVWQSGGMQGAMAALRRAAANPANATNRPMDVSFVLDRLEQLNRSDSGFKGRLDLTRVGLAGHSFGAFTTLGVAGQVFLGPSGERLCFADPRVKAAIAMSSPLPAIRTPAALDRAFGKIRIPILHMTGTADASPIGGTGAAERRLPFDHISGADQFLITLQGADHMVFAGRSASRTPERERVFEDRICECSLVFWEAFLKQDARAGAWLAGGGFGRQLGGDGTFEVKPATRRIEP